MVQYTCLFHGTLHVFVKYLLIHYKPTFVVIIIFKEKHLFVHLSLHYITLFICPPQLKSQSFDHETKHLNNLLILIIGMLRVVTDIYMNFL